MKKIKEKFQIILVILISVQSAIISAALNNKENTEKQKQKSLYDELKINGEIKDSKSDGGQETTSKTTS